MLQDAVSKKEGSRSAALLKAPCCHGAFRDWLGDTESASVQEGSEGFKLHVPSGVTDILGVHASLVFSIMLNIR